MIDCKRFLRIFETFPPLGAVMSCGGWIPRNLRKSSILGLGAALGGIQHLLPVALCSIQGDVAPEGACATLHNGSMVVGPRLLCCIPWVTTGVQPAHAEKNPRSYTARVPSRCAFDNEMG